MDQADTPVCSHAPESRPNDNTEQNTTEPIAVKPAANLDTQIYSGIFNNHKAPEDQFNGLVPLIIRPSIHNPITRQPRSNLQSQMSFAVSEPPSLFMQALSKLNENSISTGLNQNLLPNGLKSGEVTPPDSLANAPPSYSFVLRQMAARRRPMLMGTFIPSPSFVQHPPPPNYATAFDIYVDPMPPPPRVYNFGFTPMAATCPECGFTGMTAVTSKITLCTHMCAFILCVFCCWICAPLPYILRSCKDVYHYCRNCRTFLGMYCPTNPESNFT